MSRTVSRTAFFKASTASSEQNRRFRGNPPRLVVNSYAVHASFGDTDTSQNIQTTYDAAGNIVGRTVVTDTAVTSESRTVNNLNQITARHIIGGATSTSTYDYLGRMLTRTDAEGTTIFEWDGWDCVRETNGTCTTEYYVVNGQLLELIRNDTPYAVISDALGSVRQILADDGTIVSYFEYDAWGNVLPSSSDGLPGGMPYRYVGALGCRWDADTGLTYMRQRWYDGAEIQLFFSKDVYGGGYSYCFNNPTTAIDLFGLQGFPQTLPNPTSGPGTVTGAPSGGGPRIIPPEVVPLWVLIKILEASFPPGQNPPAPPPNFGDPTPVPGPDPTKAGQPGSGYPTVPPPPVRKRTEETA